MIDVSQVVNGSELAQEFTIMRSTGKFVVGKWTSTTTNVEGYGVVSVATPRDLDMVPEGDVVKGAMVFHSEQPIYATRSDDVRNGASSDILVWRGLQWRVLTVAPYEDYNYYRAVAVRLKTA